MVKKIDYTEIWDKVWANKCADTLFLYSVYSFGCLRIYTLSIPDLRLRFTPSWRYTNCWFFDENRNNEVFTVCHCMHTEQLASCIYCSPLTCYFRKFPVKSVNFPIATRHTFLKNHIWNPLNLTGFILFFLHHKIYILERCTFQLEEDKSVCTLCCIG